MFRYKTEGTCSKYIDIDVRDGIIKSVAFAGGCAGNAAGIGKLVEGRPVDQVIESLRGIRCRNGTSCPDQLALALERYVEE